MIFLDTDHSGLNKFSGRHDKNFALLLPEIQRMAKSGPSIVMDRRGRKRTEQMKDRNIALRTNRLTA